MYSLTFSGTNVLLGLAALCCSVGASIYLLRRAVRRRGRVATANAAYHKAMFSYSEPVQGLALCVAIAASVLAINWAQPAPGIQLAQVDYGDILEIETTIPITKIQLPPPPPPPPTVIEPLPEDLVEPPPFETMDTEPDELILPPAPPAPPSLAPAAAPKAIVAPPPPPPSDEPILFVQQMPTFGERCHELSGEQRKVCSDKELMAFIYQHISYPDVARQNGIEGNVVLTFVVERDGSISNVEALRKVGGGCTEEAISALQAINDEDKRFSPGIQNEEKVRVKFTMPIRFELK